MKNTFIYGILIMLAFACNNSPKEKTETIEQSNMVNVQEIELSIEGMTCTGCENAIQNKIKEFEGVYSVKASYTEGIAILEVDSLKVDIATIEEAINEVGYKAIGHKKISE